MVLRMPLVIDMLVAKNLPNKKAHNNRHTQAVLLQMTALDSAFVQEAE